jgi:general secretion pathway protein G
VRVVDRAGGDVPVKRRAGFTIVELIIVLLIIAVLGWIAYPAYQGYIARMRLATAVSELTQMSNDIHAYDMKNGALPASPGDVDPSYANRRDPWGFAYVYRDLRTSHGGGARKDKALKPLNSDFDLYSVGPDGLTNASLNNSASRDDVVRARDGAFIGTATEFDP